MTNTPPAAVILSRRSNPGHPDHELVTVRCPQCSKIHTHGRQVGEAGGHRLAHCSPAAPGYFLTDGAP